MFEPVGWEFQPSGLNEVTQSGCVLRAEYDWDDTQGNLDNHSIGLVGVTADSDVAEVVAILDAAGWDNPHTEETWTSPDGQVDVLVWRVGDAAEAAAAFFSFPDWSMYFDPDEVLLVQVPTQ